MLHWSLSPALTKDWCDLSTNGSIRSWECNSAAPSPFHGGQMASIREIQPNGTSPTMIKIDLAHTYAIAGFGKDDLASTLVFVACRIGHWGEAPFPEQLTRAYASFDHWCSANKKCTTIRSFDYTELKITSFLGPYNLYFNHVLGIRSQPTFQSQTPVKVTLPV